MATSDGGARDDGGKRDPAITRREAFLLASAVGALGAGLGARTAEGAETVHLYLKLKSTDKVYMKYERPNPNRDARAKDEVLQEIDVTKHFTAVKFEAAPVHMRLYSVKGDKTTVELDVEVKVAPEPANPPPK